MNNMEIKPFFDQLRESYLKNLGHSEEQNEKKKIEQIDNFVLNLLKEKKDPMYFLNNKLSCYAVYFKEGGKLDSFQNKRIENSVYSRFKKITNTLKLLNSFASNNNCKFLLIKSLNIIPYLPVNDIDIMTDDNNVLTFFHNKEYRKAQEFEENKINFLPLDSKKYFKISFHKDITWDNEKIIDLPKETTWKNCIQLLPHIYVNSAKIEAAIKLQESLLENLHFKLIDHVYVYYYLEKEFSHLFTTYNSNTFPYFIKFSNLIKYNKKKQFWKNLKRFFIWKMYYSLTGKIPLRERYEE